MRRSHIIAFLVMIVVTDAVVMGVLVGLTSRSPVAGLVVGVASAGAIWGVVIGIGTMIVRFGTWDRLWRSFPGAEADEVPMGVPPRVISLALGSPWWQINNAVEARADEHHLHLRLAIPAIGAARALAIPWEAVRSVEPASFGRARLDVEGNRLWLPRVLVKDELALREAMATGDASASLGVEGPA